VWWNKCNKYFSILKYQTSRVIVQSLKGNHCIIVIALSFLAAIYNVHNIKQWRERWRICFIFISTLRDQTPETHTLSGRQRRDYAALATVSTDASTGARYVSRSVNTRIYTVFMYARDQRRHMTTMHCGCTENVSTLIVTLSVAERLRYALNSCRFHSSSLTVWLWQCMSSV